MKKKAPRILLDGQYFATGSLEDIAGMMLEDDPSFTVSRLSYDPENAKERAKYVAESIARDAKESIKDFDDMAIVKMLISVIVVLATDRSKFDQFVSPALLAILTSEADAAGGGKTAMQLVKKNINRLVHLANVSAKVDGNNTSLLKEIENASVEQLDQIIDNGRSKQKKAVADTLPETVLS